MAPSVLSWLSHSESERQRALEVVDLFRKKGTRDELGIGRIRDAFSERLFPGTSTIQTRAGYFLFVPWIYIDLERRRVRSADIARRARRYEVKLIDALAESEDSDGTIGIQARGSLQRYPSDIYWGGLGTWGIRLFPGHKGQYHASLDGFYKTLARSANSEIEDAEERGPNNWHTSLPDPPSDFPSGTSFQLRNRDAEYLRERIYSTDRASLLAHLVEGDDAEVHVGFPWEHPAMSRVPSRVQRVVRHARNFSESIHGAALMYNLMLAERSWDEGLRDAELVEKYRRKLERWVAEMREREAALRGWNRQDFWNLLFEIEDGIGPGTHSFVRGWLDLVLEESAPKRIGDSNRAREMVTERERRLKGKKARLPHGHRRELELWGGDSGSDQLDYRWNASVQQIVRDIQEGLARRKRRAAGR